MPIINIVNPKKLIALLTVSMMGGALQAESVADQHPMNDEELQRFRQSFDENTLRSLFGEGASISALAELDRSSVIGSRSYDVYLNGTYLERHFVHVDVENGRYVVRFPASVLLGMPFDHANPDLPEYFRTMNRSTMLISDDVQQLLPGATVSVSTMSQRLDFDIPRLWFKQKPGNIAPQALWDWGQNAFITNYDLNAQHSSTDGYKRNHFYGAFDSRLHLGKWRFVGAGSLTVDESDREDRHHNFERRNLFATRVWGESQTRLKVGEFTTSSYFTQGVRIRGAELRLDPTMLDRDELDFVPVITGTASSQARVTVRQRGSIVYERYVSPGPFVLENIPNITSSGDLDVVVMEADGTERRFTVPFTTNGRQLRTGKTRWSVATGFYDGYGSDRPQMITFDAGWGAPLNTTLYGGGILANDYRNLRTGLAFMLPYTGAVNLEWILSNDQTRNALGTGNGMTLGFTRYVQQSGSYITARYEKALSGTLTTIDEAYGNDASTSQWWNPTERKWQIALSQSVGRFGNVNLSYDRKEVRNGRATDNLSASLTTTIQRVNVTLSVQKRRQQYSYGVDNDLTAAVTLRIPLEILTGRNVDSRHNITLGAYRNSEGTWSQQASLSGTALDDSRLSYSLQASRDERRDNRYYGSVQYRANKADWSMMAGTGGGTDSISGSVRGGFVALGDGFYFTRAITGSSVLATFPDVPEAQIRYRSQSTQVDGGVFVTSLSNYERNELSVDVNKLPNNVSLIEYVKHVVPADDALILLPFDTFRGSQMLAHFITPNGHPPFGSHVRLLDQEKFTVESMLDEAGTAYFPAVPKKGIFEVQWRKYTGEIERCRAPYQVNTESDDIIQREDLECMSISDNEK